MTHSQLVIVPQEHSRVEVVCGVITDKCNTIVPNRKRPYYHVRTTTRSYKGMIVVVVYLLRRVSTITYLLTDTTNIVSAVKAYFVRSVHWTHRIREECRQLDVPTSPTPALGHLTEVLYFWHF